MGVIFNGSHRSPTPDPCSLAGKGPMSLTRTTEKRPQAEGRRHMHHRLFSWARLAAGGALLAAALVGASTGAGAAPGQLHIAFVGDSMGDGLWGAMFRRLGKDKCLAARVKLIRHAKNGTGLTRLDQFNWVDEIASLGAADPSPDLFVGSFGINDRQPIVEQDKTRIPFPGPAFDARYKTIVEDLVRNAIAKGASMLVLGLPIMLDADANADAMAKNKIFAAAVDEVGSPRAVYAPPWTSQPPPDEYKPFLPNAKNAMVQVRASDGIHFTTAGYDFVLDNFFPAILASLKLRGRDLESECPGQVGAR